MIPICVSSTKTNLQILSPLPLLHPIIATLFPQILSSLPVQSVLQILLTPRHCHDNQDVQSPSTHLSCLLHPNTHIRNHRSLTHRLWFRICWWPIMVPIAVPSSLMTQSYIFVFLFCSRSQSIVMNRTFDLFLFLPKSLDQPHPTCYLQNNAVLWKVPLQGSLLSASSKIMPLTNVSSDTPTGPFLYSAVCT